MPKKIHTLLETDSCDFGLIGLSTPENDYRISWVLNNTMGYKLFRKEDLEIYHKKLDDPQAFHQFSYYDDETLLLYRLISNRCENGCLLEEMSHIDYLIQVIGEFDEKFIHVLVKKLNTIKEVTLAFTVDPATLKSGKKLFL